MGSASQTFHTWLSTISRMWQKRADSSDFVWLARFRLLSLYTFFKSLLLLAAAVGGLRVNGPPLPTTPQIKPIPSVGVVLWHGGTALIHCFGLIRASQRGNRFY